MNELGFARLTGDQFDLRDFEVSACNGCCLVGTWSSNFRF